MNVPLLRSSLLGFLLLCSCAIRVSQQGYLHMMCADSDGEPAELVVEDAPVTKQDHKTHAQEILAEFKRWSAATGGKRLMIVIHGGLVGMSTSVRESQRILSAMHETPPDEPCFPVFINWDTGIGVSWVDHMFFVRGGERTTLWASLTSPFVLLADLGRAVFRYPVILGVQTGNTYCYYWHRDAAGIPEGWQDSVVFDPCVQDATFWGTTCDVLVEFLPGLVRPVTSIALDTAGLPAYHNMRRRGRVLFIRDDDFGDGRPAPTGALAVLMEAFIQEYRGSGTTIPTTIIAHSMGCGVANELITRFGYRRSRPEGGEDRIPTFDFNRIVYMGAACTIREFADTALPYVRADEGRHFYNLCLHPIDEQNDRYGYGTFPHGSLLEWIDDFITAQETALDRTLGKWNNVMDGLPLMAHLPGSVRRRIHVRGFGLQGDGPHDHGDFNNPEQKFWLEKYWTGK